MVARLLEMLKCRFASTRFSGLLCAVVGLFLLILNCVKPEKMKEVFGVGGMDDEEGEGRPSAVFLEDLAISPFGSNSRLVNWGKLMCPFTPELQPELPFLLFLGACMMPDSPSFCQPLPEDMFAIFLDWK